MTFKTLHKLCKIRKKKKWEREWTVATRLPDKLTDKWQGYVNHAVRKIKPCCLVFYPVMIPLMIHDDLPQRQTEVMLMKFFFLCSFYFPSLFCVACVALHDWHNAYTPRKSKKKMHIITATAAAAELTALCISCSSLYIPACVYYALISIS